MPIFRILKTLIPLVAQAGGVAANLRSSTVVSKAEERVAKLEQETLRAGEVLAGVAEQLQAVAEELRLQAENLERLENKARILLIFGVTALVGSFGALAVALLR